MVPMASSKPASRRLDGIKSTRAAASLHFRSGRHTPDFLPSFPGGLHQQLRNGLVKVLFWWDAAVTGKIALRVKVHHQDAVALLGQGNAEVIRCGRFPVPPFWFAIAIVFILFLQNIIHADAVRAVFLHVLHQRVVVILAHRRRAVFHGFAAACKVRNNILRSGPPCVVVIQTEDDFADCREILKNASNAA